MVDGGTTILVSTHFMDEAERCHRLAILDRGSLVAVGAPRDLMRDINATVIEVETDQAKPTRLCLEQLPAVRSVAQLGTRLHALVDPDLDDPVARLSAQLQGSDIPARVHLTEANLEDVFVEATRRQPRDAATDRPAGARVGP